MMYVSFLKYDLQSVSQVLTSIEWHVGRKKSGERAGLRCRSKRVRTPIMLLPSLSD